MRTLSLGAAVALLWFQAGSLPAAAPPWRSGRADAVRELGARDGQRLARTRVLIGARGDKQVFEAYLWPSSVPSFITSDSLLNAYHIVLEESLAALEKAQARKLPAILKQLWADLDAEEPLGAADPGLRADALAFARVVLGTALRLLDEPAGKLDPKATRTIEVEVQRVVRGVGAHRPDWLCPEDRRFRRLDYSRFRPRGFYTRSLALQRYFRAVSWLQAIPFRLDSDRDLLAVLLLSRHPWLRAGETARFFQAYREFLGPATTGTWAGPRSSLPMARGNGRRNAWAPCAGS